MNNEADVPLRVHPLTSCVVHRTGSLQRSIYYAPDMDGQADSGEVVYISIACSGATNPPEERALLVIGHQRQVVLGMLISSNPIHEGDAAWLDIGAGDWDPSGKSCWVRLDKILEVPEASIRRQGAMMPLRRFERLAVRLREDYGWT